jgi:RNA polymerase sigma factor for flagellar operon FliA
MPDASDLFLENLELIDRTIASVCRRSGLDAGEIEDFVQTAKLRLMENDYAALRAFQGRSSLATYVGAVVMRFLLDERNREWGKWRRSAEAEHLGPRAVELERLLYRHGYTVDEAFHLLAPKDPGITRAGLDALAAQIPPRTRRRKVAVDQAGVVAAPAQTPGVETAEIAARVSEVIRNAIGGIDADDQLLLRLRFDAGMTVAQIARALHRDQQQLYRRLRTICGTLREELDARGVTAADVAALIGSDSGILDFNLKNCASRPSDEAGSTVADREEDS